MDMPNKLCITCLSVDRDLFSVNKIPNGLELLNLLIKCDTNSFTVTPEKTLCWECTALLQKLQKFRLQVLHAQKMLKNISEERNIAELTSLDQSSLDLIDICCDNTNYYNIPKNMAKDFWVENIEAEGIQENIPKTNTIVIRIDKLHKETINSVKKTFVNNQNYEDLIEPSYDIRNTKSIPVPDLVPIKSTVKRKINDAESDQEHAILDFKTEQKTQWLHTNESQDAFRMLPSEAISSVAPIYPAARTDAMEQQNNKIEYNILPIKKRPAN